MQQEAGTGLDDLDAGGATPRIKVLHKKGLYSETLSGIEVETFDGVVLGMLRQRVLWPTEMDEEDVKPLCKSLDGKMARPNVSSFPPRSVRPRARAGRRLRSHVRRLHPEGLGLAPNKEGHLVHRAVRPPGDG